MYHGTVRLPSYITPTTPYRVYSTTSHVLCVVCRQLHTMFSKLLVTLSMVQYNVQRTVKNDGTY
jgi:hypothetical protein